MNKYATELEACRAWVGGFSAIPQGLLEKAYRDFDEREGHCDLLAGGERKSDCCDAGVSDKMPPMCADCGRVIDDETIYVGADGQTYCSATHEQDAGGEADADCRGPEDGPWCCQCGQSCSHHWEGNTDGAFAMWGTMWAPEKWDQDWIRDHADEVAGLGFLVYDEEECGILLGIDGAGFDFYEAFWLPLYRLRGLQWHEAPAAEQVSP